MHILPKYFDELALSYLDVLNVSSMYISKLRAPASAFPTPLQASVDGFQSVLRQTSVQDDGSAVLHEHLHLRAQECLATIHGVYSGNIPVENALSLLRKDHVWINHLLAQRDR
jgi:hypothetical protein